MAHPTAPCCEIRTLVLHTYPDGIKAYGHERITTPMGRRGTSVKKPRLIPAKRAYALALEVISAGYSQRWFHLRSALLKRAFLRLRQRSRP